MKTYLTLAASAVLFACTPAPGIGAPCSAGDQPVCMNGAAMYGCNMNVQRWEEFPCMGPAGCTNNKTGPASCDTSVAQPLDACYQEGATSCSADGKTPLVCRATPDGSMSDWGYDSLATACP